jgi:hypothetical protein
MLTADSINLIGFLFLLIITWLRPLPQRRRIQASAIGIAGGALIISLRWAAAYFPTFLPSVAADWLPALLMILVYWQAGLLFRKPNEKFQTYLNKLDCAIFGMASCCGLGARLPERLSACLELAYLLCYPLVPLGVGVLYMTNARHCIAAYWAAVLPSAYFCYITTIFFETLPPRALSSEPAIYTSSGRIRAMNLWIVRRASIQVNTFPSAHVAAAMAAALALIRFVPVAGFCFLILSIGIAAGAVMGRYHYILDVVLGTMIAFIVTLLNAFPG